MPDNTTPTALIILTSHCRVGNTERKTGFYFDEMATPYWVLSDAGVSVQIASIAGNKPPADPGSLGDKGSRPPSVSRFLSDPIAMEKLQTTRAVSEIDPHAYDVVFLPGGHGTMWDFGQSKELGNLISTAYDQGAVIGAVCHGPAGLINAQRSDGRPLVDGLHVNAFTNAEEEAVGLADTLPFLLETRLRELGGRFEASANFQPHVARDGRLITGQNPQSVLLVAQAILDTLKEVRQ